MNFFIIPFFEHTIDMNKLQEFIFNMLTYKTAYESSHDNTSHIE